MPKAVSSGLQSSAAIENASVLNQTNYASVDSVAAGSAANVRVYGKAGPLTQFPSVKGAKETIQPSATIIGVPFNTSQVVAFDGASYQVRGTLPEVLADGMIPIGAVSVVGSGAPTLPTVTLVLSGGYVVGATFTPGAGLTQVPTFTVNPGTSTGAGAVIVGTGVSGGQLQGIQVANSGNGHYDSSASVSVSGGVFSGATGGGRNIGGNGGRLVVNDGTTN